MKKILLALLAIAAMASCKKSEIAPVNQVQLIEGRMILVQSTDTSFILVAPMETVNFKGSATRFVNMGSNDARVVLNGRKVKLKTVKANGKR